MANKRPGSSSIFNQPKMQKLDIITIRSPSKDLRNSPALKSIEFYNPTTITDDLWDDDNDDIILMASQQMEKMEKINIIAAMNTVENESFATFSRGPKMATSTQAIQPSPIIISDDQDFGGCFDTDFDDISDSKPTDPKPSTSKMSIERDNPVLPGPSTLSSVNVHKTIATNSNANKTKDVQIKYMTTHLEQLKRDKEHHQEKLNALNEKVQTKDGEISMLRHELQKKSQKLSTIQKEKQEEIQRIKNEYFNSLTDMKTTCKELQTKIEFQDMELLKHKFKRPSILDESRGHQNTINKNMVKKELSMSRQKDWMKLNCKPSPIVNYKIFTNEFDHSDQQISFGLNFKDSKLLETLRLLQNHLSIVINQQLDGSIDDFTISKIMEIFSDVALKLKRHTKVISNDFIIYDYAKENVECLPKSSSSICEESKLFDEEKGMVFRRIIVCVSYIIMMVPKLINLCLSLDIDRSHKAIFSNINSYLASIAHSDDTDYYQGVIEASCFMLNCVCSSVYSTDFETIIEKLLKNVILCRPKHGSLIELSIFFVQLSQNTKMISLLETICRKSNAPLIKKGTTIKFSGKSCTLQMYAEFLNHGIHKNFSNTNENVNINNLMDITLNTIGFIRSCFTIPVQWLSNSCLCRLQIVKVCIKLIYLCLSHWIAKPSLIDIEKMSNISRNAILFLYDTIIVWKILNSRQILSDFQLNTIYGWIKKHSRIFLFSKSHLKAMEEINWSQIRILVDGLNIDQQPLSTESIANDFDIC